MDGCCHGDDLRILPINRHMSYIVTAHQIVSMTISRACMRWTPNMYNINIPLNSHAWHSFLKVSWFGALLLPSPNI